MEFLEKFGVFIAQYGDKILSWLGIVAGSTIGGISVWKLGTIIVNLIKKVIEKKYTSKQKEYSEAVCERIDSIKNELIEVVRAEVKAEIGTIKDTFNELEDKKAEKKQELYEQVFNKKQKVEEIEQKVVEKVEAEIDNIKPVVEEIEQEVVEEIIEPLKEDIKPINKISMGD